MRVIGDVVDSATARVEEQARRRLPDEDRDGDRYQDAGGHQDEGERVDVHDGQMVGRRTGPGVGPKVPTKLGRRRFLAGVAILASGCGPAAARPPPASPPAALPAMDVDPENGIRPPGVPAVQDRTAPRSLPAGPVCPCASTHSWLTKEVVETDGKHSYRKEHGRR